MKKSMENSTGNKEESVQVKDFEDVLKHIGGWGPFQVKAVEIFKLLAIRIELN